MLHRNTEILAPKPKIILFDLDDTLLPTNSLREHRHNKYIIDLIRIFDKMKSDNAKLNSKLNWCYEEDDEDMLDTGKEFVKITGISMNFVSL